MPRVPSVSVPRVTAPTVSPGYAPDPRSAFTAEAFGAGIGRAMAGLGSAVAGIGAEFVERQDRVDSMDASNRLLMFNDQYNVWLENSEREWDAKGTGFAGNAMDHFNTEAGKFIQTIPEKMRPEINNRLLRLRTHYSDRSLGTQYKMQDKYSTNAITGEVTRGSGVVGRDPSQLESEKQLVLENIDRSTLPEHAKEAHRRTASRVLESTALKTERTATNSFQSRLAFRESSGQPNKVNQLGYAGLYQFGAPRMAYLGLYRPGAGESMATWSKSSRNAPGKWSGEFNIPGHPEIKTLPQFLASRDAQNTAYMIHQNKMDQEIASRGLDRFEGQTIAGVKITRSALYGMMHLGGAGGAEQWLRSGGTRSERDANRTSVGDYARQFTGFDTKGGGYDMDSATKAGLKPDAAGHWPSRAPLTDDQADKLGLPKGSGLILKGRSHETYPLTVQGERDAGYRIVEYAGRDYSIPEDAPDPQPVEGAEQALNAIESDNIADEMTKAAKKEDKLDDKLWMEDPRYSNLTFEEKLKIDEDAQRDAKQIEQQARVEHNNYVNSMYNDLATRIYDGTAGRKEIDEARKSWLTDISKIMQVDRLLAERTKNETNYIAAATEIDTRNDWVQFDPDDKKKLNLVYDSEGGAKFLSERSPEYTRRLLEIANKTKMLPSGAVDFIRGTIESGDGKKIEYGLGLALLAMRTNPGIFASHEGGKTVEDNAAKFDYYLNLNYTPAEAAERIAKAQTPEFKAQVNTLMKGKDVNDELAKSIKESDLESAFSAWYERDPNVGVTPEQKEGMLRDFAFLTKEYYLESGDLKEAKGQAVRRLRTSWGVTHVGAKTATEGRSIGSIVRFPPENAPAYAGIEESERSRLMELDAIDSIKAQTGVDVTRDKVRLRPVPSTYAGGLSTRDLYWTGQPVPYMVEYQDKNGVWNILPRPGRFMPEDLQARLTNERMAAFEKRRQETPDGSGSMPGRDAPIAREAPRDGKSPPLVGDVRRDIEQFGSLRPAAPGNTGTRVPALEELRREGVEGVRKAPRTHGPLVPDIYDLLRSQGDRKR